MENKKRIQLSDSFSYGKLLRFTLPSVLMMIFTSVYGVVDGFFVSNYVGKTSFAAVNFIMPFLMILGSLGFMFGTGGSALVAKTMGEGDREKATGIFSMLVFVSLISGVIISVIGFLLLEKIAHVMGARGEMLENCVLYGRIIIAVLPAYMLQLEFQSFFITAEKPKAGLFVTIAAGITNMVLDALFMAVFEWGLAGAAAATALSQIVGGIIPMFYFARPNSSVLRLKKTVFDKKSLFRACANGSSELMSNASMSLVGMLYNIQLIKYAGENGVSSYGVLMYVNMIFIAMFIGYSIGSSPVISFHYGAGNSGELKGILQKSLVIISVSSVCMFAAGKILAKPLARIFVGYDSELCELTCRAFSIFSYSFLFAGFAIFGSGFFTSLNNGAISALISFLRTLVFQCAAVIILPIFFKTDGIWASMIAAEVMAAALSLFFIVLKRKKYNY